LIFKRRTQSPLESTGKGTILFYFGLIGAGFMFLEIPLISQWRLFLDSPIASFSLVVGGLLFFSGLGSMAVGQDWLRKDRWFIFLVILGVIFICFSILGQDLILGWPRWIRYLVPCLGLAPMGIIMGTFFPRGITWIKKTHPELVPWAWAINGSMSVISSVVTAILSLQVGFSLVLILGGLVYCITWLIFKAWFDRVPL
jgi:hypothetical protein